MSDKHLHLQPTTSHDAVVELLDAYSTGELADAEVRLVEQHLEVCTTCQQFLQDTRRLHALLSAQQHQRIYEIPSVAELVMQEIQELDNIPVPMHNFEKLPQPHRKKWRFPRTLMVIVAVFILGILVGSFVIVGFSVPAVHSGNSVTRAEPAGSNGTSEQAPVDDVHPLVPLSQDEILWNLHMFDQNIGWATNHKGILRTNDGGLHWHNVSPTGPYDFGRGMVNFFSPDIVWMAVVNNTTQNYSTFVTADGGKSWQRSDALGNQISLGPSVSVTNLSVASAQECWLFATISSAQSTLKPVVFHTTNGGKNWMTLPINTITTTKPVTGSFLNSTTGWLAIGQFAMVSSSLPDSTLADNTLIDDASNAGQPTLFGTKDGGVSWQKQEIALPDDLASGEFGLPTFFNGKEGVLPLIFTRTSTTVSSMLIYTTHDGEPSWNTSTILPLSMPLKYGRIMLEFWSETPQMWGVTEIKREPKDGSDSIFMDHPIVHMTQDGGKTWNQVGADTSLQTIGTCAFISSKVGWALGLSDEGRADIAFLPKGTHGKSAGMLLKTTDGGRTWQTIPLVVN